VIDLFTVVPPDSSAKKRGLLHGGMNVCALLLFAFIAWRRGSAGEPVDGTSILLSALGVVGILFSGWLGATLVYRNQIGIDHRYANAGKWKERTLDSWERPVLNTKELSEGQMMLAHIEGERVAIGKCEQGMAAFSDRCTHKGGPLSDGALGGCTVQCPWHGSQFDVQTGRVVAGPAEKKIGTYEHEVRGGEVFVRASADAKRRKKKIEGEEAA
jgi:nitrite reductase/ring-hydroxylating ferredoxin subunit